MSMLALGISTAFMGAISIVAVIARTFTLRFVKEGLVQSLIYEAIATAELCACCFELIIGKIIKKKNYFNICTFLFFFNYINFFVFLP